MTNPQLEYGYTRIANSLLEEIIKLPLTASEFSVCLFVIRKTYGFNKLEDEISLTQLIAGTNRSRPTVVKALKNLKLVNILQLVKRGNSCNSSNSYKLNKYYNTWKLVNIPKLVKNRSLTSKEKLKKLVNTTLPTKDNTKDNKDIQDFFHYYLLKTKKNFTLSDARVNLIKSRLKDYPIEDMKKAVDNFVQDTWEGRKGHMDLVYCIGIRNKIDNLEKWRDYQPTPQRRMPS